MPSYHDTTVAQLIINSIPKAVFDTITPSATQLYFVDDNKEYQTTDNLVTSISSTSTNSQYPSAKCTYDTLATKENTGKITIGGVEYTVTRKALVITENNTTTTYYVADIT